MTLEHFRLEPESVLLDDQTMLGAYTRHPPFDEAPNERQAILDESGERLFIIVALDLGEEVDLLLFSKRPTVLVFGMR